MPVIRPIDAWFVEEVLPHEARLRSFARKLTGSADEAEDLLQEAFARLFSVQGWAAIENPPAYLARSLRHIAIERMRRRRVVDMRQLIEAEHLPLVDERPDQHRVAAGRESLRKVSDFLAHLPERTRTVFVRRRIEGESSKAIAADLGISISTFEKRLARAIELLMRARLLDEDIPPLDSDGDRELSGQG